MANELTIGEVASRSGVAPSALRFYEEEGLLVSRRTTGNQRRYERAVLRRIALIQAGRAAGIPLDRIRAALATLPAHRTPNRSDWERLSRRLARGHRQPHRHPRSTPQPAHDLHRLRLPLDRRLRASQPGRRGGRSRFGCALPQTRQPTYSVTGVDQPPGGRWRRKGWRGSAAACVCPVRASLLAEGSDRCVERREEVLRVDCPRELIPFDLASDGVLHLREHQ